MMSGSLQNRRIKTDYSVREQEIVRISASITGQTSTDSMDLPRKEVLTWAQRRSGGRLPTSAWDGQDFEYLSGGRTTFGVRLQTEEADLWAIRTDDPDKNIPGRNWTTEVTIGQALNETRLSVRLMVSTRENHIDIDPHVPGFMQQIIQKCQIQIGGYFLKESWSYVSSKEGAEALIELLCSSTRTLPVFVVSENTCSTASGQFLINAQNLVKATLGIAHVFTLPNIYTSLLSEAFGKLRSVYDGAVRIYMPGFNANSNPYEHRLFLSEELRNDSRRCSKWLQSFAASESLRRNRLGYNILPYATVRSAVIKLEQEKRSREGVSGVDQIEDLNIRVIALEAELQEVRQSEIDIIRLHDEAEERAKSAERRVDGSTYRIRQLEGYLSEIGKTSQAAIALPDTWEGLEEWCDQSLIGKVALTPSARRGIKKAEFSNVELVARCLIWLSEVCLSRRVSGGGSIENISIEEGIRNSPCGDDAYTFEYNGTRFYADWHIKNGGNTRDPSRCLRVYYSFDSNMQQIVVSDMPAHQRTGAT